MTFSSLPDSQLPMPSFRSTESNAERILAAIDVGTNSIHMVIVRINPNIPSFSIIARQKETVRLGEYASETGELTGQAIRRSLDALERCLSLAKSFQAEAVVAVATSAVREAPNGHDFLRQIEERLGLVVDLISGQEEARRIFLGVLSAMDFNRKPHVILDIGGGSTELILSDGQDLTFLRSVKVGAVRLTKQFLHSDPPRSDEMQAMRDYIRGNIEAPIEQIKQLLGSQEVRVIGTSGTIETLASLDARQRLGVPPSRLHGYELKGDRLRQILQSLGGVTLAERQEIPGLLERRAEIILAGGTILQEVLTLLGGSQVQFCERALREGLVVDWMLAHGLIQDRLRFQSSIRQRNVIKLATKFHVELDYAERVAAFALKLFDQTQGVLHPWGATERELLWAAAILHNCGHFISHSSHHKHSYYLIRNGELLGFNEEEIELIANLARYHRKSPPKPKHENFISLASDDYRQIVQQLSPMLRLASALDRSRSGSIHSLRCVFTPDESNPRQQVMQLYLQPTDPSDPCSLELWSLGYKKEVFEKEFNLRVDPLLDPGTATQDGQVIEPQLQAI